MYTALVMALLTLPRPAGFIFEVETNTDVVILLGNQQIEPGQHYTTEPLSELTLVKIEVRFIDGGTVRIFKQIIHLEPGKSHKFQLRIFARPPTVASV